MSIFRAFYREQIVQNLFIYVHISLFACLYKQIICINISNDDLLNSTSILFLLRLHIFFLIILEVGYQFCTLVISPRWTVARNYLHTLAWLYMPSLIWPLKQRGVSVSHKPISWRHKQYYDANILFEDYFNLAQRFFVLVFKLIWIGWNHTP